MMRTLTATVLLATAGCSGQGPIYLKCDLTGHPEEITRFKLDEAKSKWEGTNDAIANSFRGDAKFLSEQVWLLTPGQAHPGWIVDRRNLTWRVMGGPMLGQCKRADEPTREF